MLKIDNNAIDACMKTAIELCRIPSPSGFTEAAGKFVADSLRGHGFSVTRSRKGAVLAEIGGSGSPLVLAAHIDTLGAMVRSIKSNGRLRLTKIGGYPDAYIVAENCTVHTRDGREVSGTIQPTNPAAHVNAGLKEYRPTEQDLEIVLDAKVASEEEVRALGIENGDIVSLDPRSRLTENGFIKSRHLDDKASAAVLLSLAGAVAGGGTILGRKVYLLFTTYEEVGHGASSGLPDDVEEAISVDMGAVGDDLSADEHVVSICSKDSHGPYDYRVTGALIETARKENIPYAVDIYPYYGSDVEASLRAGYDVAHGLLGPGVSASHGYERAHRDGLEATLRLLAAYICR